LSAIFTKIKARLTPFLLVFSGTLPRFSGILWRFQRFLQILPKLRRILPGFTSNKNFFEKRLHPLHPRPTPQHTSRSNVSLHVLIPVWLLRYLPTERPEIIGKIQEFDMQVPVVLVPVVLLHIHVKYAKVLYIFQHFESCIWLHDWSNYFQWYDMHIFHHYKRFVHLI